MQPVATIEEVRAADERALKTLDHSVLVERAGHAVARAVIELLGTAYGRCVVVVAGKGSNGADGRVAAKILRARGARVIVVDASHAPRSLPDADVVIDAAYGTGFQGEYVAPMLSPGASVVAVDIPSGVDADTGAAHGRPMPATVTVTFAAWKPGLLQGVGRSLAGRVEVADIGVDIGTTATALVDSGDIAGLIPLRRSDAHKWHTAIGVVAGSPGMAGAASLVARGAMRSGAGMVRLFSLGQISVPDEVVHQVLEGPAWADDVLATMARFRALVVGPGIGRTDETRQEIARLIRLAEVPIVVDADALSAFDLLNCVGSTAILTPHDGEYRTLMGSAPPSDRLAAARALGERAGSVALVKGPTTVVATPLGSYPTLMVTSGSASLATAGSGDVLAGVIGGFLARGLPPALAAGVGAYVHGAAGVRGVAEGFTAGDLPALVAGQLSESLTADG